MVTDGTMNVWPTLQCHNSFNQTSIKSELERTYSADLFSGVKYAQGDGCVSDFKMAARMIGLVGVQRCDYNDCFSSFITPTREFDESLLPFTATKPHLLTFISPLLLNWYVRDACISRHKFLPDDKVHIAV